MREVRIALICLLVLCTAVQIQPENITLEWQPGTEFSEIITITNTETRPVTYVFVVDQYSQYLTETITPVQETFVLAAQDSKNIEVSGSIPALGPETHSLRYIVREGNQQLGSTTLTIPVPGQGELQPGMDVAVEDISAGQSLLAEVQLTNFGNLIAYYSLHMQVNEQGVERGDIRYPQRIQVLPGEEQTITLPYTDYLEPGNYVVELTATVNDQETLEETVPVLVTLEQETQTISVGDDLVVSLKRYQERPRVQYELSRNNNIQLEETFVANNDTIGIPTSQLRAGTYHVRIQIISEAGEDVQTFQLVIEEDLTLNVWAMIAVLFVGLILFFVLTPVRSYFRLLRLSRDINKQEKRLNTLITELHDMEEQIVNRRATR